MGTAGAEQLRQRLAQGLAARPVLREALRALGAGGFSLVLAGAGLLSAHVPLALAPVCVLPFGPAAVCAYLGAVAGYAVFWGLSAALEPVAAGFLMLAGSCLFRDLLPAQRRGFVPAAAGGIYALLGLIFVLQADGGIRAALLLALRLTLLVVSIRALCPAEETARLRPYAAAVCLLAGLVRVELPFGVPLSVVGAAAVCLLVEDAQDALLIGAACGLVLDLGSLPSPPQTACFCLPLLVCRMADLRRTARAAAFAGLVRVELPFGVPLSVVGAAAVCLLVEDAQDALLIGAACGLVLDLGSLPSPPQTACFCLPLLVCRMADLRRTARAAAFAGLYFLCVLVWGGEHAGWTLGVLAGAVFSCLLPGFALPDARRDAPAAASTLVQTADVLQRMETKLSLSGQEAQTAPALIFDSAADDVCRSCVKHQQCWQERADDTCRLLSACAGTILRQGQANEGDLPAGFCAVCIREEAFRAAINRALRAQQSQLLALRRSEEAREISRALLGQLARFLRAAGQKRPAGGVPRYRLSLGVRAVGLRGDTLCGDCGTSFQCGVTQYVLLCDGMGTGSGAQSDAQEAISVLQSLLTLGFDAMDAAAMLNELYVLRGDGCFSTVDLLEMDLCTGEGALYKWGAAPSYLKKGGTVKKIGTASPPPGLGVGEEHRAERVGLSLQRGEQLVLTTDGIPEAACEQYLRACGPLSPRELAAGVVACASESEPDDRTAVIVQLDPASMQPHHTTRRARSVSKTGAEPHI